MITLDSRLFFGPPCASQDVTGGWKYVHLIQKPHFPICC